MTHGGASQDASAGCAPLFVERMDLGVSAILHCWARRACRPHRRSTHTHCRWHLDCCAHHDDTGRTVGEKVGTHFGLFCCSCTSRQRKGNDVFPSRSLLPCCSSGRWLPAPAPTHSPRIPVSWSRAVGPRSCAAAPVSLLAASSTAPDQHAEGSLALVATHACGVLWASAAAPPPRTAEEQNLWSTALLGRRRACRCAAGGSAVPLGRPARRVAASCRARAPPAPRRRWTRGAMRRARAALLHRGREGAFWMAISLSAELRQQGRKAHRGGQAASTSTPQWQRHLCSPTLVASVRWRLGCPLWWRRVCHLMTLGQKRQPVRTRGVCAARSLPRRTSHHHPHVVPHPHRCLWLMPTSGTTRLRAPLLSSSSSARRGLIAPTAALGSAPQLLRRSRSASSRAGDAREATSRAWGGPEPSACSHTHVQCLVRVQEQRTIPSRSAAGSAA